MKLNYTKTPNTAMDAYFYSLEFLLLAVFEPTVIRALHSENPDKWERMAGLCDAIEGLPTENNQ